MKNKGALILILSIVAILLACVIFIIVWRVQVCSERFITHQRLQNLKPLEFNFTGDGDVLSQPMIISYALWGGEPCYNYGMLENALTVRKYYKNATVYAFVDVESVLPEVIEELNNIDYVKVIPSVGAGKMTWRFAPFFVEPEIPVLCRDCDSQIGEREANAVREWLEGDADFHLMRDHPAGHWALIMGGMFGARGGILRQFREKFVNSKWTGAWNEDQEFLEEVVYPHIKKDACIHDEYWGRESHSRPFPSKGKSGEYVGEITCGDYPETSIILGETNLGDGRSRLEEYQIDPICHFGLLMS